jgi:hypothetical protein
VHKKRRGFFDNAFLFVILVLGVSPIFDPRGFQLLGAGRCSAEALVLAKVTTVTEDSAVC